MSGEKAKGVTNNTTEAERRSERKTTNERRRGVDDEAIHTHTRLTVSHLYYEI